MILWGPPGVGKTTLARLMANAFDASSSRYPPCWAA
jgi:putative ATPase